ncbi:MAG: GTPase Era [Elusimicrobiota bacterium]
MKAGFVALIGVPNAGKSTLLNALLKFRLSIVSPSPQTTRHKIIGILNGKGYQICFQDTPGWLGHADDKLQDMLIKSARSAAKQDADILVLLVEPKPPTPETLAQLQRLASAGKPLILAVNKIDLVPDRVRLEKTAQIYRDVLPPCDTVFISALKKTGIEELQAALVRLLPESPAFYDGDRLSDRYERFFASELIREEIFKQYRQEIPHACAVAIEVFRERPGRADEIEATIYVERPTQKGVLLGRKGAALRDLTAKSRTAIENFTGRKTQLGLWVKVRKNWRRDKRALKELGYSV